MKKRIFRTMSALLLSCVLLLHAYPVSASGVVRIYTTEMQTAELSAYAFQAKAVDFSTSRLFRDQLNTDDQRALYDLFVSATPTSGAITLSLSVLPELPSAADPSFRTELGAYLSDLVLPAYAAAVQDTPMLFWTGSISYSCSYGMLGSELVSMDVICTPIPSNGFSQSNYDTALRQINDVLDGLSFEGNDRAELLRQFHDYLCNSITYIESTYAHNIYGALVKGEAVCEGYAKTFKLFCDLYDIPCMLITGVAVTKEGQGAHAWNAVRMEDGSWYGVDVTWDDQSEIFYDFFLIGNQSVPESFMEITFAQSHLEIGDFYGNGSVCMQFPTLSDSAYTHTHSYGEGTVTVPPTCGAEGALTFSCLTCSSSYSKTLPTVAHDYQNGACTMCGLAAAVTAYGDCNGDNVINGKDATRLLRYLANYDPTTNESSLEIGFGADCNGDGVVNGKDATRLLRYLANLDPTTGESTVSLGK